MKRLILIFILIFPMLCLAQDYYWYKGNKRILYEGAKEYIVYDPNVSISKMPLKILLEDSSSLADGSSLKWGVVDKGSNIDFEKVQYRITSYVSLIDSTDIFITNRFYVRLNSAGDFAELQRMASIYALEIIENNILPNWYTLKCTEDSEYNALQLANLFYESGIFRACEPEFINIIRTACTNDRLFHKQWNLSNIINPEWDINYCRAKTITSGSLNTIIAVFDTGVEHNHPDLNNIHAFSYNLHTLSSPSIKYGDHGTACAGIIGATSNNQKGTAGIAPLCPIMDLSFKSNTPPENLAAGFRIAADNGCSVISCSWYTTEPSEYIDEGIFYALQNGREGLGCVIVFAAGNTDSEILYPANSNEDIIVVGAMSPCGERKDKNTSCDEDSSWGSCFGSQLDIMAPGVSIYTTDTLQQNLFDVNYREFAGTSSACPHVAAVAGLVLSVNPDLTMKDVSNIIESTAQKIGEYHYTIKPEYPMGAWNKNMGYGLVDAYAAVLAAKTKYIQNHTYQSGSVVVETYPEIIAGYAVTDNKPYGNVILEAGSDVTYSATEQVVLKPGFHAKAGSNIHIMINDTMCSSPQTSSAPQRMAARSSSATTDDTESTNDTPTNNTLEDMENNMIQSTTIYTISGQLIQTISGGQHDATHLPNGMYILQHRMSDGSMRSEKIANNK